MNFHDQIILVTGGARGLGLAISKAFIAQDAMVVVNYLTSKNAAIQLELESQSRVLAVQADITDPRQVESMFAKAKDFFGADITVVVNNALPEFKFNGAERCRIGDLKWSDFTKQFEGAVNGPFNTTKCAINGMQKKRFGRIINIGTNLVQHPVVPYHDYTSAKAALLSLTRTFAEELGPYGITVNMVSGGLLASTDASSATPAPVFEHIALCTPLRKVVTIEEFSDAVLFFASPWSRAITGQNLIVDGGLVKG